MVSVFFNASLSKTLSYGFQRKVSGSEDGFVLKFLTLCPSRLNLRLISEPTIPVPPVNKKFVFIIIRTRFLLLSLQNA